MIPKAKSYIPLSGAGAPSAGAAGNQQLAAPSTSGSQMPPPTHLAQQIEDAASVMQCMLQVTRSCSEVYVRRALICGAPLHPLCSQSPRLQPHTGWLHQRHGRSYTAASTICPNGQCGAASILLETGSEYVGRGHVPPSSPLVTCAICRGRAQQRNQRTTSSDSQSSRVSYR